MKNIAAGNHTLRRAVMEDIPFLMDFFDEHWEKGCLLSRDRAYFEWEFVIGGEVNYFIAVHNVTGKIDAAMGFIPCSLRERPDGFPAIWAANPHSDTKFLGLLLGENWKKLRPVRHVPSVSMRDASVNIAKRFYGLDVCRMAHYYRLSERDDYRIASVTQKKRIAVTDLGTKLIPMPTMDMVRRFFDFDAFSDDPMYKDEWYFEHRYFQNPYYKFSVWGIETAPGRTDGILVARAVDMFGSSVLRIVDFCGPNEAIRGIGPEIDLLMAQNGFEYTDFYCLGIPDDMMREAGFTMRGDDDENIIPNHFEPFERRNVDIWVRVPNVKNIRLFKGDGDQGRPKRLRMPHEWIGDNL